MKYEETWGRHRHAPNKSENNRTEIERSEQHSMSGQHGMWTSAQHNMATRVVKGVLEFGLDSLSLLLASTTHFVRCRLILDRGLLSFSILFTTAPQSLYRCVAAYAFFISSSSRHSRALHFIMAGWLFYALGVNYLKIRVFICLLFRNSTSEFSSYFEVCRVWLQESPLP